MCKKKLLTSDFWPWNRLLWEIQPVHRWLWKICEDFPAKFDPPSGDQTPRPWLVDYIPTILWQSNVAMKNPLFVEYVSFWNSLLHRIFDYQKAIPPSSNDFPLQIPQLTFFTFQQFPNFGGWWRSSGRCAPWITSFCCSMPWQSFWCVLQRPTGSTWNNDWARRWGTTGRGWPWTVRKMCFWRWKMTGWWFGTFCIFPYIGNSNPNWLSYFSQG